MAERAAGAPAEGEAMNLTANVGHHQRRRPIGGTDADDPGSPDRRLRDRGVLAGARSTRLSPQRSINRADSMSEQVPAHPMGNLALAAGRVDLDHHHPGG
jgi:hypothetical protein